MGFRWSSSWYSSAVLIVLVVLVMVREGSARIIKSREVESRAVGQSHHDYADALTKSILFFEGQRSGYLPSTQRMTWRKHSALRDGQSAGVDLSGGYYDAGDNVKFNFPMAFTTTMLAWSVLEFGDFMGSDLQHAKYAIKWGTDYFLKATRIPNMVYVQVGQPYSDHDCWERPEDMDTDRTAYVINQTHPGSEVSAEMAAALAASSMVFRHSMPNYSKFLLNRAIEVFEFADKYQGSYNTSLGIMICPFYCDWNGYKDELVWGAAWLYKATHNSKYWNYVQQNIVELEWYNFGEFGWDDKHAGFNVLIVTDGSFSDGAKKYGIDANKFVCDVLPDSPFKQVKYTPGGLLFKQDGSNLQNPTALSFLLLVYARYLENTKQVVQCGSMTATPENMIALVKSQVDYILGDNPMNMSYMVGYGNKFPNRIHHRGSTLPSKDQHPKRMACQEGKPYFDSPNPNPNLLTGAIVGGPFLNDSYPDSRLAFQQSEPTTYINAPFVGVLAYFAHPH